MTSATSAIVLAGGQSRRLGRDKRALRLASGRTQLEETIARVLDVADDVVVAGATDLVSATFPDVRWIADAAPDAGPLGGLVAGLRAIRHELALVVACDLPLLNVEVLRALTSVPRDYDLLVPRRPDGTLEMLHALYRVTCLPIAIRHLSTRRLRLSDVAAAADSDGLVVRFVEDDELSRLDPELTSFFNVNTPTDLELARRLVKAAVGYELCDRPDSQQSE